MPSAIGEKIKLIRESERLNRRQLSELVDIPYSSLTYYESGRTVPDVTVVMKIFNQPRFKKYTMWFMVDEISPEAGQVAPALACIKLEDISSTCSEQEIG
ncbi:helix-turn-helix transcriptional regulator [Xenorhabdus sp. 12]|uniref:Helix-turn-helix transcriptional regulator n=1 Tax=Xenorhabdus santafensis TaxID=2582833 RepID=A0ABU4SA57_9GAMM|nr:helix-turn-helix transcriptional regulator [Xenorhabdus sp. 12]MDX7987687.1 helix-turn-helix transcriptional regulator [Xenorhabdus sp. 12]